MRKFLRITGYIFLILFLLSISGFGYLVLDSLKNLPAIAKLDLYRPSLITKIYDANGEVIHRYFVERRVIVPLEKVPQHLLNALIAIEDTNFFKHKGISFRGIARAMLANILAGRTVEGASTITQQLTRGLFLSPEKSYKRKMKEVLLALQIENKYSKEEILKMYLNQIYFGHGAYGVEEAAKYYFGKHVNDLNLEESAMIAGLPKAPNTYSPYRNPQKAKRRQKIVLNRMVVCNFISEEEAHKASEKPFALKKFRYTGDLAPYFSEYVRQKLGELFGEKALYHGGLQVHTTLDLSMQQAAQYALKKGLRRLNKKMGLYKSYNDLISWHEVIEELYQLNKVENQDEFLSILVPGKVVWGKIENVNEDGLIIDLSWKIKTKITKKALDWVKKRSLIKEESEEEGKPTFEYISIEKLKDVFKTGDIVKIQIEDIVDKEITGQLVPRQVLQGAIVAINPQEGHVKAMVGGYNFEESAFNRAVQARRQPGSAFKPFIYSAAIESGYTPASLIVDAPIIYPESRRTSEGMEDWSPQNYYQRFYGPTTLRYALAHSLNIVAVKLLEQVGISRVIKHARKLGISGRMAPDLTLALGTSEVTVLEITSAYGVFANQGIRVDPYSIKYVEDSYGNLIKANIPRERAVIDEVTNYLMVDMLQAVVKEGTGRRARRLKRPLAAKTGTTDQYIDTWFIGFSPSLVVGVWVGFDERISLGDGAYGAKIAGPIWVNFMDEVLKNEKIESFNIPEGIVFKKIDPKTGLLASPQCPKVIMEAFRKGTEPQKHCAAHEEAEDFFTTDYSFNLRERKEFFKDKDLDREVNRL